MAGGMCGMARGCAWHARAQPRQILQDMVNERSVRILLECIFVLDMNSNTSRLG